MLETLNDAYIASVKALGGSKAVGHKVWPAKGVESAQRHLLACLNPDRPEKLSPDECLLIEKMARAKGVHVVAEYRATTLGYAQPVPVEPEDEVAKLQREFIESTRSLLEMAGRIEKITRGTV